MTAEISILNKTAIVLAGDSAVTIGNGEKIYNTANKIFQLTENGTVGIMIYNNSNWMEIPFEIIIKEFYKYNSSTIYRYLEDYTEAFIKFLKTNISKYISEEIQEEALFNRVHEILISMEDFTNDVITEQINQKLIPEEEYIKDQGKFFGNEIKTIIEQLSSLDSKSKLIEFKKFTLTEFKEKYKEKIISIINGFCTYNSIKLESRHKDLFIKIVYKEITTKILDTDNYTGVVIAGFGNDEIFPKIQDFKIGEYFDNKIRYEVNEIDEINNNTIAIIKPFAQRDMVDTFMQGIEPSLLKNLQDILFDEFDKIIVNIKTKYSKISAKYLQDCFDETHKRIGERILKLRDEKNVQPIVDTVSYLNKEGLIELAESLVSITSLKRKTSSDIETVGGPVDIAIITKGDGFKWVKSKDL